MKCWGIRIDRRCLWPIRRCPDDQRWRLWPYCHRHWWHPGVAVFVLFGLGPTVFSWLDFGQSVLGERRSEQEKLDTSIASIVATAESVLEIAPHKAALLLRELPRTLSDDRVTQMAAGLLATETGEALHHTTPPLGSDGETLPLEPRVVVDEEAPPPPRAADFIQHGEMGVVFVREKSKGGSERSWEAEASNLTASSWFQTGFSTAFLVSDGSARFWFRGQFGQPGIIEPRGSPAVWCSFSSDDELAVGFRDGAIVITRHGSTSEEWLSGTGDDLHAMRFLSGHERVLAAFGSDGVRIWDLNERLPPVVMAGPLTRGAQPTVWLSPAKDRAVWFDRGSSPEEFNFSESVLWSASLVPGNVFKPWVMDARPTDRGRLVLTLDDERGVELWDLDSGNQPVKVTSTERGNVNRAWLSSDGVAVFVSVKGGGLWVLDATRRAPPSLLQGQAEEVIWAVLSERKSYVVASTADGSALIWNMRKPNEPMARPVRGIVAGISPNGNRFATVPGPRNTGGSRLGFVRGSSEAIWVWRRDEVGEPLLLRPSSRVLRRPASEARPLGHARCSFDPTAEHLTLTKGSMSWQWAVEWSALRRRLWELEPTNPSEAERHEVLGFAPISPMGP